MNAMKEGEKQRENLDGNSIFLKKRRKMLGRGKEQEMKSVRT